MSGGNYPPSYHLQSPQGYGHPRHRLPMIPSHRPSSYSGPPISQGHISQSSPWANKHVYGSNYHHEPPTPYYPPNMPRNYAAPRSHYPVEDPRWDRNVGNAAAAGHGNHHQQVEKLERSFQHESMDLSANFYGSHGIKQAPPAHLGQVSSRPDVNGEISRRTTSLKHPSKNYSPIPAEKNKIKQELSPKKDTVSVIAENPMHEKIIGIDEATKLTSVIVSGSGNTSKSPKDDVSPKQSRWDIKQPIVKNKPKLDDVVSTSSAKVDVLTGYKLPKPEESNDTQMKKINGPLEESAPLVQGAFPIDKNTASANGESYPATIPSRVIMFHKQPNADAAKVDLTMSMPMVIAKTKNEVQSSDHAGTSQVAKNHEVVEQRRNEMTIPKRSPTSDISKISTDNVASSSSNDPSNTVIVERINSPPGKQTLAKMNTHSDGELTLRFKQEFDEFIDDSIKDLSDKSQSPDLASPLTSLASSHTSGSCHLNCSLGSSFDEEMESTESVQSTYTSCELQDDSRNLTNEDEISVELQDDSNLTNEDEMSVELQDDSKNLTNEDDVETRLERLFAEDSIGTATKRYSSEKIESKLIVENPKSINQDVTPTKENLNFVLHKARPSVSKGAEEVLEPMENQKFILNNEIKPTKEILEPTTEKMKASTSCESKTVEKILEPSVSTPRTSTEIKPGEKILEPSMKKPKSTTGRENKLAEKILEPFVDTPGTSIEIEPVEKILEPSIKKPKSSTGREHKRARKILEPSSDTPGTSTEIKPEEKIREPSTKKQKTTAIRVNKRSRKILDHSIDRPVLDVSSQMKLVEKIPEPFAKKQKPNIFAHRQRLVFEGNFIFSQNPTGSALEHTVSKGVKRASPGKKETKGKASYEVVWPKLHVVGSKTDSDDNGYRNSASQLDDDEMEGKRKFKIQRCDKPPPNRRSPSYCDQYLIEEDDWICVFCKLGPHVPGIAGDPSGDLFGPYYVNVPQETILKSSTLKKTRKSSQSQRDADGVNRIDGEERLMEIWGHENCFLWAPRVHLLGGRICGIEDAVNDALQHKCHQCGKYGVSFKCIKRHCELYSHYSCALFTNWELDETTFHTKCYMHKEQRVSNI